MIPRWVKTEQWTGEGDPNGNADIFNRANRDLWDTFLEQHGKNGNHYDYGIAAIERGTYTGSGAGQTITLTESNLAISYVIIWCSCSTGEDDKVGSIHCINTMDTGDSKRECVYDGVSAWNPEAFTTGKITDITTTGEFDVGSHVSVDDSGETYYYLAIGET